MKVGGEPGHIKIRAIVKTAVPRGDVPRVGRAKNDPPRRGKQAMEVNRLDRAIWVAPSYVNQFRTIDARVLLGKVSVEQVESQRPKQPCRSENVENPAPPKSNHDVYGNEGHDCHRQ